MAEVFDTVAAAGFGRNPLRANEEQMRCRNFVTENMQQLLFTRMRERYLREVVICIGGYLGSDCDESLTLSSFSQMQFFDKFDELLYFVDKFDFLLRAVSFGVCNVHRGFEPRFMRTMLQVLTLESLPPPEVTAHPRVLERVPLKRRTHSEDGATAEALRRKIAALTAEQEEAMNKKRRANEDDDVAAAASELVILTQQERGLLEAEEQRIVFFRVERTTCANVPQRAPTCPNVPQRAPTCPNVPENGV